MTVSEHTSDPARALADFRVQRARVTRLAAALATDGFDVPPDEDVVSELAERGHFTEYDAELAWSPRLVVGHLRDSAQIFSDRIARVVAEDRPWLADFVTDDPVRIDGYRAADAVELASQLERAQDHLEAALGGLEAADLGRGAEHEVDGPLLLADILAFLPGHQRDHAEQLALLQARRAGSTH